MNSPVENQYNTNSLKSNKCTCEIGKFKALGKKSFRYSMCDACSERIFAYSKTSKN